MIIVIPFLIAMIIAVGFWIRNERVYKYRMDLLAYVYDRCTKDISAGTHTFCYQNDLSTFEPSYSEMVYRFWHGFDWFYPDEYQKKNRVSRWI